MKERKVILKKGKERSVQTNRHPWIFSGAIEAFSESMLPGDVASIYSFQGEFLAQGYFQMENSLAGRILSYDRRPLKEIFQEKVKKAFALRSSLMDFEQTNCFRLINAEEDGLPGLVVDAYDDVMVLQINTAGMERLKSLVCDVLIEELSPRALYEKSVSRARSQEGLLPEEGFLYGEEVGELMVKEEGILFRVSLVDGQKTGFFLDQREMRKKVGQLAKGRRLLNCFSYSGGFSLHALKGGALHVTSIDTCPRASVLAQANTKINGFSLDNHRIVEEDVFSFLKEDLLDSFDFIILDPPAFAKKRQEVEAATSGYRQINQAVFEKCRPGTLVLTCSCSYFMEEPLFQQTLFQAAAAAKREVKILSKQIQAMDHPISLYHPEGNYLKSFLLWVE